MAAALTSLATGAQAAPPAGRYDGRLCVTTPASPIANCGPARVDLYRNGRASVRINDIQYSLTRCASQVDVVLKHGAMQIDAFTGRCEWSGDALQFVDADKRVGYEVRFGERPRRPR